MKHRLWECPKCQASMEYKDTECPECKTEVEPVMADCDEDPRETAGDIRYHEMREEGRIR